MKYLKSLVYVALLSTMTIFGADEPSEDEDTETIPRLTVREVISVVLARNTEVCDEASQQNILNFLNDGSEDTRPSLEGIEFSVHDIDTKKYLNTLMTSISTILDAGHSVEKNPWIMTNNGRLLKADGISVGNYIYLTPYEECIIDLARSFPRLETSAYTIETLALLEVSVDSAIEALQAIPTIDLRGYLRQLGSLKT